MKYFKIQAVDQLQYAVYWNKTEEFDEIIQHVFKNHMWTAGSLWSNANKVRRKVMLNLFIVVLGILVCLPVYAQESADKTFVQKYVEAVNNKDVKLMKSLMTPLGQACFDKGNEKYFADLFAQEFRHTIPTNYKTHIKLLTSLDVDQEKQRISQAQRLDLPIEEMPTHLLQITFDMSNSHIYSFDKFLIWQNGSYGLDYACPSDEWIKDYWKRKDNPAEQKKYYQKLSERLQKDSQSVPLEQRQFFLEDEYGALFPKSNLFPSVWKFKTKATFRKLEIVLTGPQGEEKVLVDSKRLSGGYLPLQFEFAIGEVEKIMNGQKQVLRVGYSFGRTGGFKNPEDHPYAQSGSLDLQGETVQKVFINKIISNKDVLNVSDNITLAVITTQTTSKEFSYGITLRVQAEGSYLLQYEYRVVDGKLTSNISTGEQRISTYSELKTWAASLPIGTRLTFGPGCKRWGDEILYVEKELEDFKQFCVAHKLILDIRMSG